MNFSSTVGRFVYVAMAGVRVLGVEYTGREEQSGFCNAGFISAKGPVTSGRFPQEV